MSGTLYLVGTPIGNLGDFSPRAVQTLEEADFIAAEDTRVTLKLLNHFGIKKPMVSYFEHNRRERANRLRQGFWQARAARWLRMPECPPCRILERIWWPFATSGASLCAPCLAQRPL